MIGQDTIGTLPIGASILLPPIAPTTQPSSSLAMTTDRLAVCEFLAPVVQGLSVLSGPTPAASVQAVRDGLGPPIFSEQVADAAATTTRIARVFVAPRALLINTLAIVCDSDVIPSASDYVYLEAKRYADGAAVSSALTTAISTDSVGFAARTKRSFVWVGNFGLAAGDTLVVEVTKIGLGVALPKFEVIGSTSLL